MKVRTIQSSLWLGRNGNFHIWGRTVREVLNSNHLISVWAANYSLKIQPPTWSATTTISRILCIRGGAQCTFRLQHWPKRPRAPTASCKTCTHSTWSLSAHKQVKSPAPSSTWERQKVVNTIGWWNSRAWLKTSFLKIRGMTSRNWAKIRINHATIMTLWTTSWILNLRS